MNFELSDMGAPRPHTWCGRFDFSKRIPCHDAQPEEWINIRTTWVSCWCAVERDATPPKHASQAEFGVSRPRLFRFYRRASIVASALSFTDATGKTALTKKLMHTLI